MVVKRIVALGLLLPAMTACSALPPSRGVYSALSPLPSARTALAPGEATAAAADLDVALPSPPIPGTLKTPVAAAAGGGVNPSAVLEASVRARTAWKALRPMDMAERPTPAARIDGSAGQDLSRTAALPAAGPAAPVVSPDYDRSAAMSRLVRHGGASEKTICSGC
jgi:hypothetical protein